MHTYVAQKIANLRYDTPLKSPQAVYAVTPLMQLLQRGNNTDPASDANGYWIQVLDYPNKHRPAHLPAAYTQSCRRKRC